MKHFSIDRMGTQSLIWYGDEHIGSVENCAGGVFAAQHLLRGAGSVFVDEKLAIEHVCGIELLIEAQMLGADIKELEVELNRGSGR
jgi:hypothetical protein